MAMFVSLILGLLVSSTDSTRLISLPELPLSSHYAEFMEALGSAPLLLEAEPGAGKSTLAPLWVLQHTPSHQQVWLVQPRVLAAQALAQRLANVWGDALGQTIGYQVPYDSCMSDETRLLLMTPGVLLQRLLGNSTLDGVACVMLDEIHERGVNQDMAWALLQEVNILRDDLQLILMSATPDPALQQQIPQRLFAAGRCFPVTTQYQPPKQSSVTSPERVDAQVLRALTSHPQWQVSTCLVFLPGWREIEDCATVIAQHFPAHKILRLHSRVAASEQAAALNPAQGARIILATNIAETSLTIPDVTLVVDSGLARRAEYEQRTGITRLRTAHISQASAEQRRGRAGRVQAGHCIRLWSQDQYLAAADLPEIRTTDYLPLALRIAHWGSPAESLPWLEAPNAMALHAAQQQLQQMALITVDKKITPKGARVSELGAHPRVAALLMQHEKTISEQTLLLSLALHFELSSEQDMDDLLQQAAQELQRNRHWQLQQKRWLSVLGLQKNTAPINPLFLATAFSDRIGFLQDSGRYRLNSGMSVHAQRGLESPWAVFPIVFSKNKSHCGIGLRLQLTSEQQRQLSQSHTELIYKQQWQEKIIWRMGGVIIDEQVTPIAAKDIAPKLLAHIQTLVAEKGLMQLQWPADALRFLQRARLLKEKELLTLPDISDVGLAQSLSRWLLPFLDAQTRLDNLPWQTALEFYMGYEACQKITALLPEKMTLPSGRNITVEFSSEGVPQVSAKLQEFFGCEELQIADGRLPLKIHLLSPNGSPLAITMNLKTFWQQAYPDVRKEMRGRYPRHPWPDNPLEHEATALTKRKLALKNTDQ